MGLVNRERYLGSIVEMQRRLLLAPDHDELGTLNHALEPLARACGASRVYLFENHPMPQTSQMKVPRDNLFPMPRKNHLQKDP